MLVDNALMRACLLNHKLLKDLAAIVPSDVIVDALSIDSAHIASLHSGELALVTTALDQRLAEFASGRALLHQLLEMSAPITRADNGAPKWPDGVVGSLAHDKQRAVAAIGPADRYRALGIDIEPRENGSDDLRDSVLRPDDPAIDPIAAFVMKEAAYKAWSDLGGQAVGPLEIRLRVEADTFAAVMPTPELTVHGRFVETADAWIALATIGFE